MNEVTIIIGGYLGWNDVNLRSIQVLNWEVNNIAEDNW